MTDDLISRQAAIDLFRDNCYLVRLFSNSIEEGMTLTGIEQALNVLPTVQPKTGHWIIVFNPTPFYNDDGTTEARPMGYRCSGCKQLNPWYKFRYCPNCGAKMEGEVS